LSKDCATKFGAIYGLVNNAGIGTEGLLAAMHNTEIETLVPDAALKATER
jgi:3-oxoacyl-[acyl-carrier protein] reductase